MVEKLKKIGEIMSIVFLSLAFKDGRETYDRGRVGLLMGKGVVVFTPLQTVKEIGVFWLHCTA